MSKKDVTESQSSKKKSTATEVAKKKPEKKKGKSASSAAGSAKQKPDKKKDTASSVAKEKPEKKKSAGSAAGNKTKQIEKKTSTGSAAGDKRKRTIMKKKSNPVSEIVKDRVIRGPAYQLTMWRTNTGLAWSVKVAKLQGKMTSFGASLKLGLYTVTHGMWQPTRLMLAVEAANLKKAEAAEKTMQKVHAARGRAAARRAKASNNRAAHFNRAM